MVVAREWDQHIKQEKKRGRMPKPQGAKAWQSMVDSSDSEASSSSAENGDTSEQDMLDDIPVWTRLWEQ